MEPDVPWKFAVILVCPWLALKARPDLNTIATFGDDDVHHETFVMSCVEPSLKSPVATNDCKAPRLIVGALGVTAMLWMVAFETVNVVVAGGRLPQDAVMVTEPLDLPATRPDQ